MPLEPGTTLGPYQVTAKIGEGGMGEVYRARDTKLDRDVALKVLPQAFTDDPDRLARFEREAKVLASLNHPNIGHIYGLEEAEGTRALVLELIEGPTLADRISQGPIPIDEALPIAKQIAEALEAAHEAGVIHRDLKPANIKVRQDGTVKVLDFGLAKALDTTPEGDPSLSPTLTAAATQMGVIMGTAAYMSPEQARGSVVDHRADVWAFGVVLYEMLTARRLFDGGSVSDTLAAVLKTEPDWQALSGEIPASIHKLLRRCLTKDRKDRLQHIGDARVEIQEALTLPSAGTAAVKPVPTPSGWRTALPWALGSLVLAVVTGLAVWTLTRPSAPRITQFRVFPPSGVQVQGFVAQSFQVTPDGQTLAFVGRAAGQSQIYVRAFDQLESVPVQGTEGAFMLLGLSPDGQSLLFTDSGNQSLRRARLAGGPAERIVSTLVYGAAWGPDARIVSGGPDGLWAISAAEGERTPLTRVAEGEGFHAPIEFLPSGRAVLFVVAAGFGAPETAQVAVYDFDTGEPTTLFPGAAPRLSPTGHLTFWRDASLWAIPFDRDRLEPRGEPVRIVEGVQLPIPFAVNHAIADNGTLVYGVDPRITSARSTLGWVNREGEMTAPLVAGPLLGTPRLSPNGTRVALMKSNDVWIQDLENGLETKLTEDDGLDGFPAWRMPDGNTVTFSSDRGGNLGLYERRADRSSLTDQLLPSESATIAGSWTRDGQTLVYHTGSGQGDRDIWILPVGGEPVAWLATGANERAPRLSPNGRWLAYISDQPGEDTVQVQAFPEGGRIYSVHTGPGTEAVWSRDGQELFYRNGDELWVVEVETEEPEFRVGNPRLLFEKPYDTDLVGVGNPNYDVSLEGEQLLMVQQTDITSETGEFVVVQNWFEELTRLVPTN
jgi:serine/threonine-protein kinase